MHRLDTLMGATAVVAIAATCSAMGASRPLRTEALVMASTASGQHRVFGKELANITSRHPFYGAAISPDGSRVATISVNGGEFALWDATNGHEVKSYPHHFGLNTHGSNMIAFTPDSARVIVPAIGTTNDLDSTQYKDQALSILDARSGEILRSVAGPLRRFNCRNSAEHIAMSGDGRRLAAHMCGDAVALFDTESWSVLGTYRPINKRGNANTGEAISAIALDTHGETIAEGYLDGEIQVADAISGERRIWIDAHSFGGNMRAHVNQVLFNRKGDVLFSAADLSVMSLPGAYDVHPELQILDDENVRASSVSTGKLLRGYIGASHGEGRPTMSIALSPDEHILVAARAPIATDPKRSKAVAFDVDSGEVIDELDTSPAPLQSIMFDRDGKKMLIAAQNVAATIQNNM